MDDLEFRRRAYAEPDSKDSEFLDAKNSSDENTALVEELQAMDESMKQALHIQPPAELAERIKLQQTLNEHQHTRKVWQYSSMAASIILVFAIVIGLSDVNRLASPPHNIESLASGFLQHIYEELDHLTEQKNPSLSQLNEVLGRLGGKATGDLGQLNYLGSCNIAGVPGVHLVVQGEMGPVTIMLLPDVPVSAQHRIIDERFNGIIQSAGNGSMAIVGEKGEGLEQVQSRLNEYIHWI